MVDAGGQAKRVNIGLGLVACDTRLLFLDEPTSGLDSFTANEVARFGSSGQALMHEQMSYFSRCLL